jgi:internalin A
MCFKTATDSYIAPDALPPERQVASQIQQLWRKTDTLGAAALLDYPFLHEGILRAILCHVGEKAGESAVYWDWGVCFYDLERQSTVRIRSEPADHTGNDPSGRIIVEARGGQVEYLVEHLIDSILQIKIGAEPEVHWTLGGAKSSSQVASEEGKPDEAFARIAPGYPPLLAGEPLPVYVSYAWGGESDRLVNDFARRLPQQFRLIQDKTTMRAGDWISRFMRDIGRAERVLVVLSEKYLKSVYCMRELLHIYHASLGERANFSERVVVLTLDDLKFSRAADRLGYARYWQEEEEKKLNGILKHLDRLSIGDADRAEQLAIKDFGYRVSDILSWISDTLMPRATSLSQEALDRAVELFQRRATGGTAGGI